MNHPGHIKKIFSSIILTGIILLLTLLMHFALTENWDKDTQSTTERVELQYHSSADESIQKPLLTTPLDRSMIRQGLVDVYEMDPTLARNISLRRPDQNTARVDVILSPDEQLTSVYLRKEVANKLKYANTILRRDHPDLILYPIDGVRPRSVQLKLWEEAVRKGIERYFANPYRGGSFHNFGVSVDVTIVNSREQRELNMGTPVGYLGALAEPRHEDRFLQEKKLTIKQIQNRAILRRVMKEAGFFGIAKEWWHFNGFPRHEIRGRFSMVD